MLVADLLSRLGGGASGEEALTRLPPERFDAARFRRIGLVSGWHEAQVGPAVAGRHRGRLWVVAEAGLDRLDERTPKRRVRGRAFFGLLVAVELVGEWPAVLLLRRRGAIVRTLRHWSPPARDLDPVKLTGVLAERFEAWGDGSGRARALLAEGGRRDARQDRGGDRGAGAVRAHGHGAAGGAAAAAVVAEGGGEGGRDED
jgi:hypothetical protein